VGSLITVSGKLSKYVRFSGSASQMGERWHQTCRRIHIILQKGNENHELGTGVFVHKRIISAVKRIEFVSDRN
jgi:hypothetical protein